MPKALGRYEIVRELGKGAMGVVYEGIDPIIGRRVAIKTARRDVMESSGRGEELMKRFLREARAAGSLSHPNIITIYDADEQDGVAYMAMEYIESGTLRDYIARGQRLTCEEIAEIGAVICEALASAHEKGIIHRDVKPANIMTLPDGTIKMADFGIAHVTDSDLTQEGSLIGTPHFMSPEQFMGQKVDGRSDLFSVGVIVYEMLTGEKPFTGEALSTVMHHVLKVDPVGPKELNYACCDHLSKVVMKAMAKSPGQRYQTGAAMAAALRESIKEHPDPIVMGFAPSASETAGTVVLSDPEATATHVTASGPPPQPEPSALSAADASTAVMKCPPVGAAPKRSRLSLVLVGLAAVLALLAGALWLQSASGPRIRKVDVGLIVLAETAEAADAARKGDYEAAGLNTNGAVTMNVIDLDTGEVFTFKNFKGDTIKYLDPPPRSVRVEFIRERYAMQIETSDAALTGKEDFVIDLVVLTKVPE